MRTQQCSFKFNVKLFLEFCNLLEYNIYITMIATLAFVKKMSIFTGIVLIYPFYSQDNLSSGGFM